MLKLVLFFSLPSFLEATRLELDFFSKNLIGLSNGNPIYPSNNQISGEDGKQVCK